MSHSSTHWGHQNAFDHWAPRAHEGVVAYDRRGMLKASLAGMAGLSVPNLLRAQEVQAARSSGKSVILLWMAGGPSQIDTWDPKPDRPVENRGPFSVIPTKLPGVMFCEHLPKQAAMLDKMTIIRSVDCRKSNHEPNKVMQTGNLDAAPRVNPAGDTFPSYGSVIAKHHGPNQAGLPAYATFMKSKTHVAFAGSLGREYDPFIADSAAKLPIYTNVGVDTGKLTDADLFKTPLGVTPERIESRRSLLQSLDRMASRVEPAMDAMDKYQQKAVEMLLGSRARSAFDISAEPESVRERYGKHLWCQQALLARRMVEAGVAFVTLDLSYHGASGTWDNHGDNIPPYGGISKGLKPLLPLFDHLLTTLVSDLEERGLLDKVLIVAMGEFGRTPQIGTQGSTDGRNHWPYVMSMTMAGGGLRHGQVIGSTEKDGGQIADRPVSPGDLAATIYKFMGVPLDTMYNDINGRPFGIVRDGKPIHELFG
ncbi:hypothetical protein Pla52o_52990 [Novipirellula galeiformis]|uniref:Sulfatase n=1 Tax=Novipirellula galeiformis TaxID=2528004 RepID=A0A5C6BYD4_9BACT|nr:DUF1501 domain-containing protein [Novipirellula galeiformis]TWU17293.1 hypothetical protein Pla52o_52990 [Novipirellula galeiformis]